jgi:hypothetical protein
MGESHTLAVPFEEASIVTPEHDGLVPDSTSTRLNCVYILLNLVAFWCE